MEGNPFADLIPQQNSAGFTGYIPGVPKPAKVDDPLDIENKQLTNQKLRADLAKSDAEANAEKDKLKDALAGLGLDELLMGVKRARDAVGTGRATGITGAVLGMVPGTTASDLRSEGGYLDQIQGGIIMEKLQSLKDASKTGASGMGALSEREGARMAASVTALGKNMSDEALNQAFSDIERHAKTLQAVRDGMDPRDPAVQEKYGIPQLDADIWGAKTPGAKPPGGGTPPKEAKPQSVEGLYEGGPQSDAGMGELDAKQKQAYAAFWKANPSPSPAALSTFLSGIGVPNVREADAANIIKGVKSGLGYSTAIDRTSAARAEIARQNRLRTAPNGFISEGAESSGETLLKSGQTLNLSDEAAGIGRSLSKAVQGENPFTGYVLGRDAERLRIEDARRQLGWTGTAIEVGGGLLSANPGALSAVNLTGRELAAQGARGGFAGGALAGWGSGEGAQDSLTRGIAGGAGGALVGGALGGLSGRLGARGMDPELAAAADAEGVSLIKPMVDPSLRGKFGQLESGPASQPIIRRGVERVEGEIEAGVARLGGEGGALEPAAAGERLQAAGNRYITRSKGIKDRLYGRAENIAGDARLVPQKALEQVDAEIADLSGNPSTNGPVISFLEGVRNDLATPGGKTVAEIRNIREGLRGSIGRENLTVSDAERRALNVMRKAADDISEAVPAAGSAYRRADAFYAERQTMVDDIKRSILGRKSDPLDPQQAYAKVKALTAPGANGRRLAAIMRHLEPDERQDIAATVAMALGRDSADGPFSAQRFLTATSSSKFSPSALRTVFGPDGAQSVQNLRLLSRRLNEAQSGVTQGTKAQNLRYLARTFVASITGVGGGVIGGGATGVAAGVAAGAVAGAGASGLRMLSARAMVNPRVSRWLAEAANVNTPTQAAKAVRSLGTVMAREPALANELAPIQRYLSGVVSTPAAASDAEQGGADNEQR